MRPSAFAIAACLICALLLWLTRPLWPSFGALELTPAGPSSAPASQPVAIAPDSVDAGERATPDSQTPNSQALPPLNSEPESDPWRRPLLSPITDTDLPRWSASVMARQARRSAMAELADVPQITEETVEKPVRQQQAQALATKPAAVKPTESRAERKRRQAKAKAAEQRAARERLKLTLPQAANLLPPVAIDLEAAKTVSLPDLINRQSESKKLEFHGRVLTNEDLGRDPIEPPRNALDEIQGAELGIRYKTP